MHKDHKILIYTTTRVLTLIFLANAYAEPPIDEDTMVYHSSRATQCQFEEPTHKEASHIAHAKEALEFIDPKKVGQKTLILESGVEENLPLTPQGQAIETTNTLEEIAEKTSVVRTVAGFTLEHVKEMANLATLSYTGTFDGEAGIAMKAKLTSEGWEIIEFSTQAERSGIVLLRGGEAMISYHGSESVRNFATDAYATMSEIEWASGYAHTGFLLGFEKTWDQVYGALNTHATKQGVGIREMKIKVVGHSLGAALATLAAYRLAAVSEVKPEVINFASPRVFDRNAASNYEKELKIRTLRVVHKDTTTGTDPVTLVGPGILGFKHIGALFEIEKGGAIPHLMGGYHGALGNLRDEQFEATKHSGNGFFGWLNQ